MNCILLIFIIFVFISGIYFYIKHGSTKIVETMVSNEDKTRCPNLLIQKGSNYYLYNTKLAKVPGVNPITFNNLDEYTQFLKWQRSVGIRCPVLYLQYTYDLQGEKVYKIRPSPNEPQYGLPPSKTYVANKPNTLLTDASRNDYPYNTNSYPGYDQQNQNIGVNTPLDEMNDYESNMLSSDDAMKTNWNPELAQKHIDEGYYKENEVQIYIP